MVASALLGAVELRGLVFGALPPYLIPSSLELINGEARAATMSSGTSSTGASRPPITEFSAAKDAPNLVEAQEWLRIGPTPVGNACGAALATL